jgi:hypothetical protein
MRMNSALSHDAFSGGIASRTFVLVQRIQVCKILRLVQFALLVLNERSFAEKWDCEERTEQKHGSIGSMD